jgi:hypothetical protein
MQKFMGVVFDIGHQSVGYEDIPGVAAEAGGQRRADRQAAGAASMHIPESRRKVDALQAFAKTIYLSQTCQKKDGKRRGSSTSRTRSRTGTRTRAARVAHPLPRAGVPHRAGPRIRDDAFGLEQALAVHKKTPLSTHLEIETYTWDVLPDHLKTGDIVEYVTREIEWVKGQLCKWKRKKEVEKEKWKK